MSTSVWPVWDDPKMSLEFRSSIGSFMGDGGLGFAGDPRPVGSRGRVALVADVVFREDDHRHYASDSGEDLALPWKRSTSLLKNREKASDASLKTKRLSRS